MAGNSHALLPDTIAQLERLVAFPTVSQDSNLELIDYAAEWLEQRGAHIKIWKNAEGTKANCFATIGPDKPGGVILSGHSDVVPVAGQDWSTDPFRLCEKEGRLYGRGTCDMKGFVACALAMASDFAGTNLRRPLHIALTYDEETGCLGGQQLVKDLAASGFSPSACIVGEPTSMRIIEGHKGCYEYTTYFSGLATHGSLTHQGVNAIENAVRYITRLMELRDTLQNTSPEGAPFSPPYTTLQIGRINGGVSRNTIAGECSVEWEMRPVKPDDADYIKRSIAEYVKSKLLPQMRERAPDARVELETIAEVVGLTPATQNEARDICQALTGEHETDVVSFGTEAGLFQQNGIATVVCGPGSIEQAQKPDEFIEVSELGRCLTMLEGLKHKLSG